VRKDGSVVDEEDPDWQGVFCAKGMINEEQPFIRDCPEFVRGDWVNAERSAEWAVAKLLHLKRQMGTWDFAELMRELLDLATAEARQLPPDQ
jgi:hypothetical protein